MLPTFKTNPYRFVGVDVELLHVAGGADDEDFFFVLSKFRVQTLAL